MRTIERNYAVAEAESTRQIALTLAQLGADVALLRTEGIKVTVSQATSECAGAADAFFGPIWTFVRRYGPDHKKIDSILMGEKDSLQALLDNLDGKAGADLITPSLQSLPALLKELNTLEKLGLLTVLELATESVCEGSGVPGWIRACVPAAASAAA